MSDNSTTNDMVFHNLFIICCTKDSAFYGPDFLITYKVGQNNDLYKITDMK